MKATTAIAAVLLVLVLSPALLIAAPGLDAAPPTAAAIAEIPADLLPVYVGAAATCEGLPWQVLAAVGFTESRHGHGRSEPVTGAVHLPIIGPPLDGTGGTARIPDPAAPDGWAHALGPMQFLPSTWARWGRSAPGRPPDVPPDPHNAWDAIYSAAAYLCGGPSELGDLEAALLSYNRSRAYVTTVMSKAVEYGYRRSTGDSGLNCPVAGAMTFTRDWGAPRSGGRRHQGNDLFARHGTPLVAVEDGTIGRVSNTNRGLGGLTVWLNGNSGTRYYYAHNSRNAVATNQLVTAGQVVAYVGNTGNAATTPPHVHFEIHPAGQPAIDPFPALSTVCPPD